MKKYNDLRDYNNWEFVKENLSDFSYITLNVIAFSSILKLFSDLPNDKFKMNQIILQTTYFMTIISSSIYTTLDRIEKNIKQIDLRKLVDTRNKIYNQIIKNIADYIDENCIEDPICIMKFLHDNIYDGKISYKKIFFPENKIDEPYNYSYQIIKGNGVCRSFAQLTTDVFRCLGYEAYDVFCTNLNNELCHLITMLKLKNKTYYLDSFNNAEYSYDGKFLKLDCENIYIPLNYYNDSFNKIDRKEHCFVFEYYIHKRTKNDYIECVLEELDESLALNSNLYHKKTNEIYKTNKKLYKKFKKTYL